MKSTGLTASPAWKKIRPHVRAYRSEKKLVGHVRVEVSATPAKLQQLLLLRAPCAACGTPMHPVRTHEFNNYRSVYLATTCLQKDNSRCSRSCAAHEERRHVTADVGYVYVRRKS